MCEIVAMIIVFVVFMAVFRFFMRASPKAQRKYMEDRYWKNNVDKQ